MKLLFSALLTLTVSITAGAQMVPATEEEKEVYCERNPAKVDFNKIDPKCFELMGSRELLVFKPGGPAVIIYSMSKNQLERGVLAKKDARDKTFSKHGVYYKYRTDKTLYDKSTYKYGQRHGYQETYRGDGTLHMRYEHQNDQEHGTRTTHDKNGERVKCREYKEGKPVGDTKPC